MKEKLIVSFGIIAPLLFLGKDILAGKFIKGYDFFSMSMGEFGSLGSPVRPLVIGLDLVANSLLILFAVGIWQVQGATLMARVVAGLIITNAVTSLAATLFFPGYYGVRPEFGTPGVLLMAFSVLCFMLAMLISAVAYKGWLRVLSIAIPAAYLFLALLRIITASSSGDGRVLIGAQERTMAYSYLVWVISLACYHLFSLAS